MLGSQISRVRFEYSVGIFSVDRIDVDTFQRRMSSLIFCVKKCLSHLCFCFLFVNEQGDWDAPVDRGILLHGAGTVARLERETIFCYRSKLGAILQRVKVFIPTF